MPPDAMTEAEAVVADFGTAWGNRDMDATLALCAEDCLFEATGPAPDGVQHVGHAELRSAWQAIFDDASARFEVEDSFAAGPHVVQRWLYTWADGHIRGVDLFVVRDGKVAEKRSYVKG
jgi:ketosteroid isomerase-like protein